MVEIEAAIRTTRKFVSLRRSILFWILLSSTAITTVLTAINVFIDYKLGKEEIASVLGQVEKTTIPSISLTIWDFDQTQMHTLVDGLTNVQGVLQAEVWDKKENVLYKTKKTDAKVYSSKTLKYPLKYDSDGETNDLGHLNLLVTEDFLLRRVLSNLLVFFVSQGLKTLVISLIIFYIINLLVVDPLILLANELKNLRFNKESLHLYQNSPIFEQINTQNNEFTILFSSYHTMIQHLAVQYDEKEVELQIQKTRTLESARLASLGEMAGGIAHEINNPLTIISMRMQQIGDLVNKEPFDVLATKKVIASVATASDRITKIIKGMRAFARDSANDPFEEVEVERIIHYVLDMAKERLNHGGVKLFLDLTAPQLKIICREVQIAQVLINLINNSYDAVAMLNERWIKISTKETADQVEIAVIDSGKGIPPELVDKIMRPFFTSKAVGKGTGLGLSISAAIIEDHKGKLEIDQTHPNTAFRISLPKT